VVAVAWDIPTNQGLLDAVAPPEADNSDEAQKDDHDADRHQ
jgi:hypothetical protein